MSEFWDLTSLPFDVIPFPCKYTQVGRQKAETLSDDFLELSFLTLTSDIFASPFEKIDIGGVIDEPDLRDFTFDESSTVDNFQEAVFDDVSLFDEGKQTESELVLRDFILSYLDLGYPDKVSCTKSSRV